MKKVLIIQTASIGDVILSTPVIEKINYIFREAEIDILIKKGNESLFKNHPYLNQIILWDKSSKKYSNLFNILAEIRKSRYDLVINIQRFASTGLLTVLSGAKMTAGFNKNPFSLFFTIRKPHKIKVENNIHETARNLSLIDHLKCDKQHFDVKLYPSQKDYAYVSQFKTVKYICIAPASLWFTKQFPKGKWVDFLKNVDRNLRVYFLGSKSDFTLCDSIIKDSGFENSINLAGKLTFLESAALMKDAVMNFVNDSSPMHLASSVNAPVTAIFCSTVPEFGFGPLSENSSIVQISEKLSCRPCGLHGYKKCPKGHFKCGYEIDINSLLSRLE